MAQRRTALLIATDTYTDQAFARLRAPANDVAGLAEVLADPEIGAFDVRKLVNEPAHVVRREIAVVCREAQRGDLILLYVSGHGIKDDDGHLHFVMTDSDRDLIHASSVPAQVVRDDINKSRAHQAIVWLDCCYSGAFPTGGIPKSEVKADVIDQMRFKEARGWSVMTASTHIQYAYEPGQHAKEIGSPEVSVFTNAIIEGLKTGHADIDGDGEIGTVDLYNYVYARISDRGSGQTPTKNDQSNGEILVARNRFALALPAGLTPAIRNLLKAENAEERQLGVRYLQDKASAGDKVAQAALDVLRSSRNQDLAKAAVAPLPEHTPNLGVIIKKEPRQPTPVRAPRHAPPKRLVVPDRSEPRLSDPQQLRGMAEAVVVVAALVYMTFLHDGVLIWTIVFWLATAVAVGVAVFDLGRMVYRVGLDTSRVLHRADIWASEWLMFSPDGKNMSGHELEWATDNWATRQDTERRQLVYHPDNSTVIAVDLVGRVVVCDRPTGGTRMSLDVRANGVALSSDGRVIAVAENDEIKVIRTDSGDVVARLARSVHRAKWMSFDPSGRLFAVSTKNDRVRCEVEVFDTSAWEPVELPQDFEQFISFAFDPDGSVLAVGRADSRVDLWHTKEWRRIHSIDCGSPANTIEFSPDGRLMAVGDWRGRIVLYKTSSWRKHQWMIGHHGWVTSMRFSPDSGVLASTCADDKTLRVWQVRP